MNRLNTDQLKSRSTDPTGSVALLGCMVPLFLASGIILAPIAGVIYGISQIRIPAVSRPHPPAKHTAPVQLLKKHLN